jgi:tetrahydromethanopterin S-methyltransferase subunit G
MLNRLKRPELRDQKIAQSDALASQGDIPGLVDLATDPDMFGQDQAEFSAVKSEFDTNQRVLDHREAIVEATRRIGRDKGQEIALAVLSAMAIGTVLTQLYFWVMVR